MKILVITNHSYMFWRFRRELMVRLLEEHEVVLSTPFVGHEDDLRALGCRLVETEVDRRGINPVTDSRLIRTYAALLEHERPDLVITYSIKPNIYAGFLCRIKNIPYFVNVQGLGTAFQKKGLAQLVTIMYRHAVKKAGTVFFENEGKCCAFPGTAHHACRTADGAARCRHKSGRLPLPALSAEGRDPFFVCGADHAGKGRRGTLLCHPESA